jgi:hypothetical protein
MRKSLHMRARELRREKHTDTAKQPRPVGTAEMPDLRSGLRFMRVDGTPTVGLAHVLPGRRLRLESLLDLVSGAVEPDTTCCSNPELTLTSVVGFATCRAVSPARIAVTLSFSSFLNGQSSLAAVK